MPPISWTSKWRIPIVRRDGLAHDGEGLGQEVVERLAVAGALAQRVGVRAQLVVVEQLELGLPLVDALDALRVLLELLAFAQPEGAVEDRHGSEDRGPRGPAGGPRRRTGVATRRRRLPGPSASGARPGVGGLAPRAPRAGPRRLSRWRLTWRASSSEIRLIECLRSREASRARSVVPLRWSVASATWLSGLAGLRSSHSSTSSTASSRHLLADLLEAARHALAQLVGDRKVASLDLDLHGKGTPLVARVTVRDARAPRAGCESDRRERERDRARRRHSVRA